MAVTSADLDAVLLRLRQHDDITLAYLFGSAADGDPDARDIDLAIVVTGTDDPLRTVLLVQQDIEAATGATVDVHDLDALPVDLQFRVIDQGRPVLVRDETDRVRREVRIMREYWDLRPYLDRIRDAARARLAAGAGDG